MTNKFQALYESIKKQLLTEHKSKEFNDIEAESEIVDANGKIWNIYGKANVKCEITFNDGERESFDSPGEPSGWELTKNPIFSNLQIINNDTEELITSENTEAETYNNIKSKIEDAIMSNVSKEIEELDPEEEYFIEPDDEPDFDYENYDYDV